jgi:phosphoribosylformylglycinamidine synthase II
MAVRIEVGYNEAVGHTASIDIAEDLGITCVDRLLVADVYTIDADIEEEHLERARRELFTDPVTQKSPLDLVSDDFDFAVEVGYLPGVADNPGITAREAIEDLCGVEFKGREAVYSSRLYLLKGTLSNDDARRIAGFLANPVIERVYVKTSAQYFADGGMDVVVPRVELPPNPRVDTVDLEVSEEKLMKIAKGGILDHVDESGNEIRRGPLALDMESMHAIRDYFRKEGRSPTDVELESIAQTWSEHCQHKIFASPLDEIEDGIFKTYIRAATEEVRRNLGSDDWCVSVFTDNSGIVKFNDDWHVCYKAETHNSPSALDPYGGAMTGIDGVNRDPLGTGKGARPAINMYGFCFGNPFYEEELPYRRKGREDQILHPKRIFKGVRVGVEHGGNTSGIPTPWGWIIFDDRYMGKPLVFVGTVGVIPARVGGKPSHEKAARPGDHIIMVGGRVGRDGIHGATFSSEALHAGSPMGAVQIDEAITQKKMSDALVEARDMDIYNSITDNGAGGLSCSVGEMANECGGCEVDIEKVPTKYPNLPPNEVWISESQDRMTLAVPEENVKTFIDLMRRRGAEATDIGRFTDSGRCIVRHEGNVVMDVDLEFLHEGWPRKDQSSTWTHPEGGAEPGPAPDLAAALDAMLGRLNICSKEYVVRQYDHEVQGGSVVKPLVGVDQDVHSDGVVTRPVLDSLSGVALSAGIFPRYGDIDPYSMAACGIDAAIRGVLAVGADPSRVAILDNFCWCSSDDPERLGQLKRAAKACYDMGTAFNAPFISGKDSMYNDFKGFDGDGNSVMISIPPTLLVSSLGIVKDVRSCVTMDVKCAGDLVYVLGTTKRELGCSEYYAMRSREDGTSYAGGAAPSVDAEANGKLYAALGKAVEEGLVASCHSVTLGGLGVALARTAFAGMLGVRVDLDAVPAGGEDPFEDRPDLLLFSESAGRLVVTVDPAKRDAFEKMLSECVFACVGEVTGGGNLVMTGGRGELVNASLSDLKESYKKTLRW